MQEKFDKWCEVKKQLNNIDKNINFHTREIWYISIGENIGFEQNGKGKSFLRPVIVYRKFNNKIVLLNSTYF